MAEMITVGGVLYRKEDAARLNLTADTKAYAEKIANNEVPVGLAESDYKETTSSTSTRKAAGGDAGTTTTGITTSTASTPGSDAPAPAASKK